MSSRPSTCIGVSAKWSPAWSRNPTHHARSAAPHPADRRRPGGPDGDRAALQDAGPALRRGCRPAPWPRPRCICARRPSTWCCWTTCSATAAGWNCCSGWGGRRRSFSPAPATSKSPSQAMRQGAYDYLIKDVAGNYLSVLPATIDNVVQREARARTRCAKARPATARSSRSPATRSSCCEDGRFVECNPAALRMFGCSREEFIGHPPYEFSPPRQPDGRDSREKAQELIGAALAGQPQSFEWRHLRSDGTLFDSRSHAYAARSVGRDLPAGDRPRRDRPPPRRDRNSETTPRPWRRPTSASRNCMRRPRSPRAARASSWPT